MLTFNAPIPDIILGVSGLIFIYFVTYIILRKTRWFKSQRDTRIFIAVGFECVVLYIVIKLFSG